MSAETNCLGTPSDTCRRVNMFLGMKRKMSEDASNLQIFNHYSLVCTHGEQDNQRTLQLTSNVTLVRYLHSTL